MESNSLGKKDEDFNEPLCSLNIRQMAMYRELLGGTMCADEVQLERMGVFSPGHALCSYEPLLKPFEIQIPEFKFKDGNGDTDHMLEYLVDRDVYMNSIANSLVITQEKWDVRLLQLRRAFEAFQKRTAALVSMVDDLERKQEETGTLDPGAVKECRAERSALYKERIRLVEEAQSCILDVTAYRAMVIPVLMAAARRRLTGEAAEFYEELKSRINDALLDRTAYYKQMNAALNEMESPISEEQKKSFEIRVKMFS